jgi:hypothetical protein
MQSKALVASDQDRSVYNRTILPDYLTFEDIDGLISFSDYEGDPDWKLGHLVHWYRSMCHPDRKSVTAATFYRGLNGINHLLVLCLSDDVHPNFWETLPAPKVELYKQECRCFAAFWRSAAKASIKDEFQSLTLDFLDGKLDLKQEPAFHTYASHLDCVAPVLRKEIDQHAWKTFAPTFFSHQDALKMWISLADLYHKFQDATYNLREDTRLWLFVWRSLKVIGLASRAPQFKLPTAPKTMSFDIEAGFLDHGMFEDVFTDAGVELGYDAANEANCLVDIYAWSLHEVRNGIREGSHHYSQVSSESLTSDEEQELRGLLQAKQVTERLIYLLQRATVRLHSLHPARGGADFWRRQNWGWEMPDQVLRDRKELSVDVQPSQVELEDFMRAGLVGHNRYSGFDYVYFPFPETRALGVAASEQISREMREPGIHSDGARVEYVVNRPPRHVQPPKHTSLWYSFQFCGPIAASINLLKALWTWKTTKPRPRPQARARGGLTPRKSLGERVTGRSRVPDAKRRVSKSTQIKVPKLRGGGKKSVPKQSQDSPRQPSVSPLTSEEGPSIARAPLDYYRLTRTIQNNWRTNSISPTPPQRHPFRAALPADTAEDQYDSESDGYGDIYEDVDADADADENRDEGQSEGEYDEDEYDEDDAQENRDAANGADGEDDSNSDADTFTPSQDSSNKENRTPGGNQSNSSSSRSERSSGSSGSGSHQEDFGPPTVMGEDGRIVDAMQIYEDSTADSDVPVQQDELLEAGNADAYDDEQDDGVVDGSEEDNRPQRAAWQEVGTTLLEHDTARAAAGANDNSQTGRSYLEVGTLQDIARFGTGNGRNRDPHARHYTEVGTMLDMDDAILNDSPQPRSRAPGPVSLSDFGEAQYCHPCPQFPGEYHHFCRCVNPPMAPPAHSGTPHTPPGRPVRPGHNGSGSGRGSGSGGRGPRSGRGGGSQGSSGNGRSTRGVSSGGGSSGSGIKASPKSAGNGGSSGSGRSRGSARSAGSGGSPRGGGIKKRTRGVGSGGSSIRGGSRSSSNDSPRNPPSGESRGSGNGGNVDGNGNSPPRAPFTAQVYHDTMFAYEMVEELIARGVDLPRYRRTLTVLASMLARADREGNLGWGNSFSYRVITGNLNAKKKPKDWVMPRRETSPQRA